MNELKAVARSRQRPADAPDDNAVFKGLKIAVVLPCYNEERTIGDTVAGFRRALPDATVYVYDNNSRDRTVAVAREEGAVVRNERRQGKGNVVRRMFADVEADVYVMADGDNTYDASAAPALIRKLLDEHLDMVVGARAPTFDPAAYRRGHKFGNRLLTGVVARIFGKSFDDILSGYRVFSRRFVKSFPALSGGFETETELTVHALHLKMPVAEVATRYGARPEGSSSKLSTYKDGVRILHHIMLLFKEEKPLLFFSIISGFFALASIGVAVPIFLEYARTGLVPRLPTAVLAAATMGLAFLSMAAGLILDTVSRGRRESKRLHYLHIPGPSTPQAH